MTHESLAIVLMTKIAQTMSRHELVQEIVRKKDKEANKQKLSMQLKTIF